MPVEMPVIDLLQDRSGDTDRIQRENSQAVQKPRWLTEE